MKVGLISFASGIIAPELLGRIDLVKYKAGVRDAVNFRALPHGPMARRPGFVFVGEAGDSSTRVRLIPFAFSASQAMILEFGDGYVRFHNSSGTLLESSKHVSAVSNSSPATFSVGTHGFAVDDPVYLTGLSGMPSVQGFYRVSQASADTFQVTTLAGLPVSTATTGPYVGGGSVARVYEIASPYSADEVALLRYAQNSDVLTLVSETQPSQELRRYGANDWRFTPVSFVSTVIPPGAPTVTVTNPTTTNPTTQSYVISSVLSDGVTESAPSAAGSGSNNLAVQGNYNTVSWGAVSGVARYNVYKLRGGVYGYIGETTGTSIVDDNILPDLLTTPPGDDIDLNDAAGNYPGAVTYYEQRRFFAGTLSKPQNVFATRNGTESNLTSSVPARDDDALEFRIAAQQQNAIRHLVPLVDLLALTAGGEFRIFADGGPAITPTTLSVKPQAYVGAATVQPALTSGSALYVQAQGSRIRELAYDPQGTGAYRSIDVSLFAPHLFNGYTITQLAYQRAPDQMLWGIRSDGQLLGLTYVPEQQVFGWHRHVTDGLFESCAVIPEGGEDVLYVVVLRTINGRTARYIERMSTPILVRLVDSFFVDSGLTYSGTPVTSLYGLSHLEGKTVQVLADGAEIAPRAVTNGMITLDEPASIVHVGLPFDSDMQTLPAVYMNMGASGQGTMKNVNRVHLRVSQSAKTLQAGPSFNKLKQYPSRAVSDAYGSPPALMTGEVSLTLDPSWNTDASVCIRQSSPLPLTVLSMTPDDAVGG